jgi:hypothetical protein
MWSGVWGTWKTVAREVVKGWALLRGEAQAGVGQQSSGQESVREGRRGKKRPETGCVKAGKNVYSKERRRPGERCKRQEV